LKSLYEQEYERPEWSLSMDANMEGVDPPVYLAVKLKRSSELINLLVDEGEYVDEVSISNFCRTPLHLACQTGQLEVALCLLEANADPTFRDTKSKTPYSLCKTKQLRLSFRKFAGKNPDLWDWKRADVPPLTEEDEKAQKAATTEKRREKRKKEKVQEKKKKEEEEKKKEEEEKKKAKDLEMEALQELKRKEGTVLLQAKQERRQTINQLTDREKRALAAEQRLAAVKGTARLCDMCRQPLVRVPFHRLEYQYCSTLCLQNHKEVIKDPKFS